METTALSSCNEATLTSYIPSGENPWDSTKINHVYRRLGFGASQDTIDLALSLSPNDFIDTLVDEAINKPPTTTPFLGNYVIAHFTNFEEIGRTHV